MTKKFKIKAILFDMDDTIIHSSTIWYKVVESFLGKENIPKFLESNNKTSAFSGVPKICKIFKEVFKMPKSEKKLEQEIIKKSNDLYQEKIEFLPGFINFHRNIKNQNCKSCIATNAYDETIKIISEKLRFQNLFGKHIYKISDVNNKAKPNPDIFIYAAKQLGISRENCVVFEDSEEGVSAAKNAKIKCVGINSRNNPNLISEADLIINDYSNLTLENIEAKLL